MAWLYNLLQFLPGVTVRTSIPDSDGRGDDTLYDGFIEMPKQMSNHMSVYSHSLALTCTVFVVLF